MHAVCASEKVHLYKFTENSIQHIIDLRPQVSIIDFVSVRERGSDVQEHALPSHEHTQCQ